jgi:rubredoxin
MNDSLFECPQCSLSHVPRLIVRGTSWPGKDRDPGISLQCRNCRYEWSESNPVSRQAS